MAVIVGFFLGCMILAMVGILFKVAKVLGVILFIAIIVGVIGAVKS